MSRSLLPPAQIGVMIANLNECLRGPGPQLHPCVSLIYHCRALLTGVELSDTKLPGDPERVSGDQLYQWIRSHFLSAFHLSDMYAVQSDWDLNYYLHHSMKCCSFKETCTHLLVCYEIPFYIISLFSFFTVLIYEKRRKSHNRVISFSSSWKMTYCYLLLLGVLKNSKCET